MVHSILQVLHRTIQLAGEQITRILGRWSHAWCEVLASALGAALAWVMAERLLGHHQPIFAPISAEPYQADYRFADRRGHRNRHRGTGLGFAGWHAVDAARLAAFVAMLGLLLMDCLLLSRSKRAFRRFSS
jgi:hypothetical protein